MPEDGDDDDDILEGVYKQELEPEDEEDGAENRADEDEQSWVKYIKSLVP